MKAEGRLGAEDGCSRLSTGPLRAGEVGLVRTVVISHPVIIIATRMITDDESFIVNLSLSASLSSWNRALCELDVWCGVQLPANM
jgi:hypothetical protein